MKEKCDKVKPLHPEMFPGKIVSRGKQNYAKAVTQSDTKFDYYKEIPFSSTCKSAKDQ